MMKGSNKFCRCTAGETLLSSVVLEQELEVHSGRPEEIDTERCVE